MAKRTSRTESSAVTLTFERLSRFDRPAEPCTVAVPFPSGVLAEASATAVYDGERALPTQARTTATWSDGTVKWLLVHFLADLPGNLGKTLTLTTEGGAPAAPAEPVTVETSDGLCTLRTDGLVVELARRGERGLFRRLELGPLVLGADEIAGPSVTDAAGGVFTAAPGRAGWEVVESGPVRAVVETQGRHARADGRRWLDYVARVYAFAGKPWIRLDYRIIHREEPEDLVLRGMGLTFSPQGSRPDSIRTALARSNYRSAVSRSDSGGELSFLIDADHLLFEANEQIPETLYGTFWADWTDPRRGGLCVTIHQAQQNYPKRLTVSGTGLSIELLPRGGGGLHLVQGMAKTHRLFLHLHGPDLTPEAVNVRSLQFQMPDRATVPPEVWHQARVTEDAFTEPQVPRVERYLVDLADKRTRAYGILHWGDCPDVNYTQQGRGRGELVWTNNEYDLPHAALLMYARTGERRMLDYLLVAAEHWMDVDVCHHSSDPLRLGGQIVHSARHATGAVTPSHEWVEGLLDYWHQTGEHVARDVAVGIGENVLRHLERPHLRSPAGASARETGWALRTLVALHLETHEERWLAPAEFIVDQFGAWAQRYGAWLAPYTDHTLVRVPFMIAVAVNSLMRYWRVRPGKRVGEMIVTAVRDLLENCLMADGRFYYKELPSLRQRSAGVLVLEALAHAYEVSGDVSFLSAGIPTFELVVNSSPATGGVVGRKYVEGDAVVWSVGRGSKTSPTGGSKSFAAGLLPVMAFYRAAIEAGLL